MSYQETKEETFHYFSKEEKKEIEEFLKSKGYQWDKHTVIPHQKIKLLIWTALKSFFLNKDMTIIELVAINNGTTKSTQEITNK